MTPELAKKYAHGAVMRWIEEEVGYLMALLQDSIEQQRELRATEQQLVDAAVAQHIEDEDAAAAAAGENPVFDPKAVSKIVKKARSAAKEQQ